MTPSEAAWAHDVLSSRRPLAAAAALAGLGASSFLYVTCENMPIGLLPGIAASLRTSLPVAGLLLTVYAGAVTAAQPLTHLTRHVPRRYLLSGALGVLARQHRSVALAGICIAARGARADRLLAGAVLVDRSRHRC